MDFLSGLALVFLTLTGFSAGAVIGARDRSPTPRLLDLTVVVVLWITALPFRSALGKWAAIGVWLVAAALVSFVLSIVRRNKMPSKQEWVGVVDREGNPLRKLWEGWKGFVVEMGDFQGRILLAFFYISLITPFGVSVRLLSDPLRIKHSNPPSFWNSHPATSGELGDARRQF
jgi:hypothetical protein